MKGNYIHVVYDIALGECGVRYCPRRMWCTILPCGNVVYDIALGGVWCTMLPWRSCGVRCYPQAACCNNLYNFIIIITIYAILCICSAYFCSHDHPPLPSHPQNDASNSFFNNEFLCL